MPGLIPLMLMDGNRPGLAITPPPTLSRRAALPPSPPPPPPPPPTVSVPSTKARAKRLPVASSTMIHILPSTVADWKQTIAELKSQHINRRFRACASQCDMILENIRDLADIEPAYLMSLHFYAATSSEMCARFLSTPSGDRNSLLQKARVHYHQAAILIRSAEEAVFLKAQTSLVFFSHTGHHSPSDSISSRTPTSPSGLSTPALSVCSSEDSNAIMQQSSYSRERLPTSLPPARKGLSFGFSKEGPTRGEPTIRPDSPTLGFDDEYFTSAHLRQSLPETPSRSGSEQVEGYIFQETTLRDLNRCCFDDQNASLDTNAEHFRCSFFMSGSASRYSVHLASLKTQLARHRENLEAIIETTNACDENYLDARRQPFTSAGDKMQALERQTRIERLRKSGWQRKRFDPSRYEALRVAALADLK